MKTFNLYREDKRVKKANPVEKDDQEVEDKDDDDSYDEQFKATRKEAANKRDAIDVNEEDEDESEGEGSDTEDQVEHEVMREVKEMEDTSVNQEPVDYDGYVNSLRPLGQEITYSIF